MKVIDLSHRISEKMEVYPGDEPPRVELIRQHSSDGYQVTRITMNSHTGTHVDTPAHFFENQADVVTTPVNHFVGKGHVINLRGKNFSKKSLSDFFDGFFHTKSNVLYTTDFLLIYTGWDQYWNEPAYYLNFPVIPTSVIKYLTSFSIKGIGLDTPSLDSADSKEFENHRLWLGSGKVIIENLTNLDQLIDKQFIFVALPLKISHGDGSPVRAAGLLL